MLIDAGDFYLRIVFRACVVYAYSRKLLKLQNSEMDSFHASNDLQTNTVNCDFSGDTFMYLHCVSKNTPDIFSCNLNEHFLISIILAQILRRVLAIEIWFIFPPHLNSVSALPCKTDKHKNSIFSLNVI